MEKEKIQNFNGLKIPVEPQKEWKWMIMPGAVCDAVTKDASCSGISCPECIYSAENYHARSLFYRENFSENIENDEYIETFYDGSCVYQAPKPEWSWMLEPDSGCKVPGCALPVEKCKDCIYNSPEKRSSFYKKLFPHNSLSIKQRENIKKIKEEIKKIVPNTYMDFLFAEETSFLNVCNYLCSQNVKISFEKKEEEHES